MTLSNHSPLTTYQGTNPHAAQRTSLVALGKIIWRNRRSHCENDQARSETGGFDEDYFCYVEDVDLGFRLRLAGFRCLYVQQSVAHQSGLCTTGGQHSDFALYHGHRNLVWTMGPCGCDRDRGRLACRLRDRVPTGHHRSLDPQRPCENKATRASPSRSASPFTYLDFRPHCLNADEKVAAVHGCRNTMVILVVAVVTVGFATRNLFDNMFAGSLAHHFWILVAAG
jgi:hypothetical protein